MSENFEGYHDGISFWEIYGICKNILGYLTRISFQGYVDKRYPESPKISFDIFPYPIIPQDILRYLPWGKLPDGRLHAV
jgi:hypothetical protein